MKRYSSRVRLEPLAVESSKFSRLPDLKCSAWFADRRPRAPSIKRVAYLALLSHGNPGDYYVVAEDQPVSVLTVHEEIAKQVAHGRTICQTRVSPPESSKVEALLQQKAKHRISSERFKQHTGWQARESFLTSFPRFLPR